jgi:hypothetical protein
MEILSACGLMTRDLISDPAKSLSAAALKNLALRKVYHCMTNPVSE